MFKKLTFSLIGIKASLCDILSLYLRLNVFCIQKYQIIQMENLHKGIKITLMGQPGVGYEFENSLLGSRHN